MTDTSSLTKPAHRPKEYTQEMAERICDHIRCGGTLMGFCRDEGAPNVRTVQRWVDDIPDFRRAYAQARLHGATALVEEFDEMTREALRRGKVGAMSGRDLGNMLRVIGEQRRWLAERFDRSTYAQRIEHQHHITHDITPEAERAQLISALAQLPREDRREIVAALTVRHDDPVCVEARVVGEGEGR